MSFQSDWRLALKPGVDKVNISSECRIWCFVDISFGTRVIFTYVAWEDEEAADVLGVAKTGYKAGISGWNSGIDQPYAVIWLVAKAGFSAGTDSGHCTALDAESSRSTLTVV